MRIDAGQHMRMDQRMKLAPRMIQSMEILQMPMAALEERVEQELASNPTLELREPGADKDEIQQQRVQEHRDDTEGERQLVVDKQSSDGNSADDFERLSNITEQFGDSWESNNYETGESYRPNRSGDGERDAKLDAMANTASRPASLHEQLMDQWRLVETTPQVRTAGEFLIGYIDADGYIRTERQTLISQAPSSISPESIDQAWALLQVTLEPVGMAARDLRECLLLQIDAAAARSSSDDPDDELRRASAPSSPSRPVTVSAGAVTLARSESFAPAEHPSPDKAVRRSGILSKDSQDRADARLAHANRDYSDEPDDTSDTSSDSDDDSTHERTAASAAAGPVDELAVQRTLVSDYLKDIEMNRLPRIAKATGLDLETIKRGLLSLRQFHPHPGRVIAFEEQRTIAPDAIIEFDELAERYTARLTNQRLPNVHLNPRYLKMARDAAVDRKTREFIGGNLRSARWLIDAIAQRNSTLLRVINVVIEAQRDFFDQGPQYLKPLPMTLVADQLGIHVATVSRAVSEKYLQTPRGIFPLRMFFSGGTETESGDAMSWAAVQAKLREIVDQEDKTDPLSDDQLVDKLKELGIEIARRTVAKYRQQLNIASARQRRQF